MLIAPPWLQSRHCLLRRGESRGIFRHLENGDPITNHMLKLEVSAGFTSLTRLGAARGKRANPAERKKTTKCAEKQSTVSAEKADPGGRDEGCLGDPLFELESGIPARKADPRPIPPEKGAVMKVVLGIRFSSWNPAFQLEKRIPGQSLLKRGP